MENNMNFIKLTKASKILGITKQTLWNWKYQGKISFIKCGNLNGLSQETLNSLLGIRDKKEEKVVIYCRVSSTANKKNLETQKERLISYCIAKGYKIHKIVCEFGSGINDKRPKLQDLLENQDFTKIVVEHKDRLTRLGFNYLDVLLKVLGKEIEVINNAENDESDIIQDFTSIITSFCARIYGNRRSKRKTEKLIEELKKKND